jgi:hypothetical protein
MHVLVLDPALIPISIDVVIGDNVYELHFKVELKDMQENPKPLEMDENGDDTNGKEDENGNEQLDFMQEDSEHNSKEKCADQGFANKQMGKRVGGGGHNNKSNRYHALDSLYELEDNMRRKWALMFSPMMSCKRQRRRMLLFMIQQARG